MLILTRPVSWWVSHGLAGLGWSLLGWLVSLWSHPLAYYPRFTCMVFSSFQDGTWKHGWPLKAFTWSYYMLLAKVSNRTSPDSKIQKKTLWGRGRIKDFCKLHIIPQGPLLTLDSLSSFTTFTFPHGPLVDVAQEERNWKSMHELFTISAWNWPLPWPLTAHGQLQSHGLHLTVRWLKKKMNQCMLGVCFCLCHNEQSKN